MMPRFVVLVPFQVDALDSQAARVRIGSLLERGPVGLAYRPETIQVFPAPDAHECCSGINGSHTARCETWKDRLTCWCCGGTFPTAWACLWSGNGSRCFACEGHPNMCRLFVGRRLEEEE